MSLARQPMSNALEPLQQEDSYQRYLAGLLEGDLRQCRAVFEEWLNAEVPLEVLYFDFVHRSLYEVGTLWERGQIPVSTEHVATAITESLLSLVYPRLFAVRRTGRSALVACVGNEHHRIGAKLVADFFELRGWRAWYLGGNSSPRDLLFVIGQKKPDVVALSATMEERLDSAAETAAIIRSAFPDLPILVGGQAFLGSRGKRVEGLPGLSCVRSLSELESWMSAPQLRTEVSA